MSIAVTPAVTQTPSLTELVAEEIRALMARRRVKQSDLARALGKSEQWVSVRLRAVQPIDLNDLQGIAGVLNVEIADLLPAAGRITAGPRVVGGNRPEANSRNPRTAERTRPISYPNRTSPDPSTRRPGHISQALIAA
jgi:transcriptional regulator with XRE-family HTH domain